MTRKTYRPAELKPGMHIEYKGAHLTETAEVLGLGRKVWEGQPGEAQVVRARKLTASFAEDIGADVDLYFPVRRRVRLVAEEA